MVIFLSLPSSSLGDSSQSRLKNGRWNNDDCFNIQAGCLNSQCHNSETMSGEAVDNRMLL